MKSAKNELRNSIAARHKGDTREPKGALKIPGSIYERQIAQQQRRATTQRAEEARRFESAWITDAKRRIQMGEIKLPIGVKLTIGSAMAVEGLWRRRAQRTIIDVLKLRGLGEKKALEASKKIMREEYDAYFIQKAKGTNGGLNEKDVNLLLNNATRSTLRMIAETSKNIEGKTLMELLKARGYTTSQAKNLIESEFEIRDGGTKFLAQTILEMKYTSEMTRTQTK